ncbi:hypothetical protein BpHYR1_006008 [Brachionus plicatilis]|uniref:Uncharacterized protein n=1 Tax=Brachionus plicatilis TaxID=10195 RepID=A0A3M7SWC0_BRAPC|nr:hypothetical protein BpHYR1_006008 [Brachionus plicatilis]
MLDGIFNSHLIKLIGTPENVYFSRLKRFLARIDFFKYKILENLMTDLTKLLLMDNFDITEIK